MNYTDEFTKINYRDEYHSVIIWFFDKFFLEKKMRPPGTFYEVVDEGWWFTLNYFSYVSNSLDNLVLFGQQTSGWQWRPTGYNPHPLPRKETGVGLRSRNSSCGWGIIHWGHIGNPTKQPLNCLVSTVTMLGSHNEMEIQTAKSSPVLWLIFKKISWDRQCGRHYSPSPPILQLSELRFREADGSPICDDLGKVWTSFTKQRLSSFPHFQEMFSLP